MQTETGSLRSADWRAAVIAGVLAGLVFLVVNMALTGQLLGNAQLPLQLAAALLLGPSVMPPAVGLGGGVFMTGFGVHLVLAVGFTCLIAFCLHRWGIWVGIFGGALFLGSDARAELFDPRAPLFDEVEGVVAGGTGGAGFFGQAVQFFFLADIGAEGNNLSFVVVFEPRDEDGGVEAAGICEDNFHNRKREKGKR